MSELFTTVNMCDINDLLKYLQQFPNDWVFRGQSNVDWTLETSIERTKFWKKSDGYDRALLEKTAIDEFERGAQHYLGSSHQPENQLEWLSFMQHFGVPTRLLDFSHSPYIATFFAVENNPDSACIWAINALSCEMQTRNYFPNPDIKSERDKTNKEIFDRCFAENTVSCVFPVEPYLMNNRFRLQQSLFLCPGNVEPFMDNLKFLKSPKSTVKKIIIDPDIISVVLYELLQMNISRDTLFPGLDGFAATLKTKFELKYGTDIELGRSLLYHVVETTQ